MFICERCGICCRNLSKSELYSDLDSGNGICKYFDTITNLCSIYENRPIKCNVDKLYKLYFQDKMSIDDYYQLNYKACNQLKGERSI